MVDIRRHPERTWERDFLWSNKHVCLVLIIKDLDSLESGLDSSPVVIPSAYEGVTFSSLTCERATLHVDTLIVVAL
jgi:hypothetical protein